jgi:phosphoserine phosphatase
MLIALDFGSTLARIDPFVQLAEQNGLSDDVAALLDRIASGEIGFEPGLRSVADHLDGLQDDAVENAVADVRMGPTAVI